MEGAGSRMSRASSRYGPATTVFSGPVRRWKKKWVHVPPSPSSFSSRSQSKNNDNNSSRLMLCRWTPISAAATASGDERPRRRFRYTPVAVLDEQKKTVEKRIEDMEDVENTSEGEQSTVLSDKIFGKSNADQVKKQETEEFGKTSSQASSMNNLNLDLGLQGHSASLEFMNKMKEGQTKTASSGSSHPDQNEKDGYVARNSFPEAFHWELMELAERVDVISSPKHFVTYNTLSGCSGIHSKPSRV